MQVNPISAIHALRIRQNPVVAPTSNSDVQAAGGRQFNDPSTVPAYIVADASRRDPHHGERAEYTTQLLASHQGVGKTYLEQRAHLAQYSSAATREPEQLTHTISLVA
ncbi:MAG: hypothetical protein ABJN26_00155 [Stappiaceae bacterium]